MTSVHAAKDYRALQPPCKQTLWRRAHRLSLVLLALAGASLIATTAAPLRAQQVGGLELAASTLPEAPSPQTPTESAAKGTATISGVVSDIRGGLVPGAQVTLTERGHAPNRELTSDSAGHFAFTGLEPGVYTVLITSAGLESFLSPTIVLKPNEKLELPDVALPIAANTTTVDVVMTQAQVADEELKLETQQRVLGVFPNFYTSFLWNAAPLNAKQKVKLSLRTVIDPISFITPAIVAGIEQERNTFPGYGDDADAYGKRYGAAFGDATIGRLLGSAVFPSLFRQDPRYFYMGPAYSTKKRLKHALLAGLVARGDNGKWQPNYSHIAGNASAGAISTLYHPDDYSAGGLALRNGLIGVAGGGVQGLVREFVTSRVTHKVPAYAKGKPPEQPVAPATPAAAATK